MGRNEKRKHPRSFYIKSAKRQKRKHNVLGPGLRGFLCTCNSHERDCVREAFNLLNQFANKLYGPEHVSAKPQQEETTSNEGEEKVNTDVATASLISKRETENGGSDDDGDDDDVDIDAALKADLKEMQTQSSGQPERQKQQQCTRFRLVASGASNCIFIKTTLPDPLSLSLAIMDHIIDTQEQCTKRLLRLIPVQVTCKAFQDDIEKAVKHLAEAFFEKSGKTFYVAFKARNNNSVKRETLIASLVKILQGAHPQNTPDVKTSEVVLNVEVIKNNCCLSLLPWYFSKYSKYNVVTIATKRKGEQNVEKKVQEKVIESRSGQGETQQLQCKDQNGISVEDKAGVAKVKDEVIVEEGTGQDGAGVENKMRHDGAGVEEGMSQVGAETGERMSQDEAGVEEGKNQNEAGVEEGKSQNRAEDGEETNKSGIVTENVKDKDEMEEDEKV